MNFVTKSIFIVCVILGCYYGYTYYCNATCKTSETESSKTIPCQKNVEEPAVTPLETPQSEKVETITMKKITTPTGLAYEVITEAKTDALAPKIGQTVSVHYTGWLDVDGQPGKKFDSSVDRGQQFQFPVGMGYVIAGWDQAVADMKVGEKRRVYIPSDLGYGARGAGAAIPPHANLIFDIELFDIQ